jgi:hypothetical protein
MVHHFRRCGYRTVAVVVAARWPPRRKRLRRGGGRSLAVTGARYEYIRDRARRRSKARAMDAVTIEIESMSDFDDEDDDTPTNVAAAARDAREERPDDSACERCGAIVPAYVRVCNAHASPPPSYRVRTTPSPRPYEAPTQQTIGASSSFALALSSGNDDARATMSPRRSRSPRRATASPLSAPKRRRRGGRNRKQRQPASSKTTLCKHRFGRCKRVHCAYAHSVAELERNVRACQRGVDCECVTIKRRGYGIVSYVNAVVAKDICPHAHPNENIVEYVRRTTKHW